MNCKQGDMAIRVQTGQLVDVVRLFVGEENFTDIAGTSFPFIHSGAPAWVVSSIGGPLEVLCAGPANGAKFMIFPISDKALKPIRDADGEDEMLRIAGKPEKVQG